MTKEGIKVDIAVNGDGGVVIECTPENGEGMSMGAKVEDFDLTDEDTVYWLRKATAETPSVNIMGPAPLPVVKINNRYRYRIHIACHADAAMRRLVSQLVTQLSVDKRFKGVSVYADNDPIE